MLNILKRASVAITAMAVTPFALYIGWHWLLILSVPIALLGLYDWFQTNCSITRNYPAAGRIRWFFLNLRPYLHSYIVEDDLNGSPYSYEARRLITSRARAEPDTHPFGTERDTDNEEYHWINHSIAAETAPDPSPRVLVGNEQTRKPYSASVFNISAMSFGALSAAAIEALNIGAK
ncbi:hypothetical protein [Methylomonas methanica]|uniref:hypothetical protein n=1 Tax=Methylomonas methanica TaxID=421 RepID=UPI000316B3DF|nr:hypothetical protein [Methylomonas methanica]